MAHDFISLSSIVSTVSTYLICFHVEYWNPGMLEQSISDLPFALPSRPSRRRNISFSYIVYIIQWFIIYIQIFAYHYIHMHYCIAYMKLTQVGWTSRKFGVMVIHETETTIFVRHLIALMALQPFRGTSRTGNVESFATLSTIESMTRSSCGTSRAFCSTVSWLDAEGNHGFWCTLAYQRAAVS